MNLDRENWPGKRNVNAVAIWQRLLQCGNADAEITGERLR
jgi:hypothetical protein